MIHTEVKVKKIFLIRKKKFIKSLFNITVYVAMIFLSIFNVKTKLYKNLLTKPIYFKLQY